MKKQTPHSEIERLQRMIRVQEKHTEAAMIGRKKREQKILYGLKTKLNMTLKEQVKAELESRGVKIPVTANAKERTSTRQAIADVQLKYSYLLSRETMADILGVSESELEWILKF